MEHVGLEAKMVKLEEYTVANLHLIPAIVEANILLKSDLIS